MVLVLAKEGDIVLVPAPYYVAFDADIKVFARCRTVPVHSDDPTIGLTGEGLEKFAAVEAEGTQICYNNQLENIFGNVLTAFKWSVG